MQQAIVTLELPLARRLGDLEEFEKMRAGVPRSSKHPPEVLWCVVPSSYISAICTPSSPSSFLTLTCKGSVWAVASSSQPDESTSLNTLWEVESTAATQDVPAGQSVNYCTDIVETAKMLVYINKTIRRLKRHRSNRLCSFAIIA